MNCVSLVCTVHEEVGLANVSELHAILERMRPEVIFLEVPPAAFEDYYEICSRGNLESKAVRQYRNRHEVDLIPVDLPTPEREFFENEGQLRMRMMEASPEYRQLMSLDFARVQMYGFAYLNSDYCSELWANVYKETVSTLGRLGDSSLVEIYESFMEMSVRREKEMMENIRMYCRKNSFKKALFLVGAAHRQPIIDNSREQSAGDSTTVQWDFAGCVSLLTRDRGA